jgi:hypothetical protein
MLGYPILLWIFYNHELCDFCRSTAVDGEVKEVTLNCLCGNDERMGMHYSQL